jgi:hypothetical protein
MGTDAQRRRELIEKYKAAKPQMGVVFLRCTATGETFMSPAKNTSAALNGIRAELEGGNHPNRRLQTLWDEQGADSFESGVVETLDYVDGVDDYTDDLESLCAMCLERVPGAEMVWKRWR